MMKRIREEQLGPARLVLATDGKHFYGRVFAKGKTSPVIEGDEPDEVWEKLRREAGRQAAGYVGYDGAMARFLAMLPGGFSDPKYFELERDYKVRAAELLRETLPLEAALDAEGAGEAALAVFRATNLLSPFEQMRVTDVLRGPDADAFVRAAAAFTLGEVRDGLARMAPIFKPAGAAKWTVVTYLPFLWAPETNMFLKPQVTRDFAERVGHSFTHEYSPELDEAVYRSLLDLAAETRREIARLEPRDAIDIQSFIWVVGFWQQALGEERQAGDDASRGD